MNTPLNAPLVFTTPGTLHPPGKEKPTLFGGLSDFESINSQACEYIVDLNDHPVDSEYYVDVSFSAREGWDGVSGVKANRETVGGSWHVDATAISGGGTSLLHMKDMGYQLSWVGADKVTVQQVTGPLARGPT